MFSHVAKLLSQSTQHSSEEDLPSLSISDEETQFLGQDEKQDDIEKAEAPPPKDEEKQESRRQFLLWIVVNTLATIGIVRSCECQMSCTDRDRSSRIRPSFQTLSSD